MRQRVEIKMVFSNLSQTIHLMNVYQKGNTLITVSNLQSTGNFGEAVCMRKDAAWVETNSEKELAVKHYIINPSRIRLRLEKNVSDVSSLDKIHEIAGLQPLPMNQLDSKTSYSGFFTEPEFVSEGSDDLEAKPMQINTRLG